MKMRNVPGTLGLFVFLGACSRCEAFQPQTIKVSHPKSRSLSQDDDNDTAAKVRFSGFELDKQAASTAVSTSNPLDSALSFISSDIASIALGLIGLCLLLVERLTLPDATTLGTDQYQYAEKLGEETRSNLIAVLACGSVLLNGISKLDVTSALAEAVELEGVVLSEPANFDNPLAKGQSTLQWSMKSFLQATPAKTVVLLQTSSSDNKKWTVRSMMGTVPAEATLGQPAVLPSTPILDRFLKKDSRETYLPTLQALPGKTEFTYIPDNTQEVLILSVPTTASSTTAILLGSNRAKSFTPRDVAWCQTLAARLGAAMSTQ